MIALRTVKKRGDGKKKGHDNTMSDEKSGSKVEQVKRELRIALLIALGAVALAGIGLAARGIDRAVTSEGRVDYCWIEVETPSGIPRPTYVLKGHRPYRTDPRMGVFDTFELASGAAASFGCPLGDEKKSP